MKTEPFEIHKKPSHVFFFLTKLRNLQNTLKLEPKTSQTLYIVCSILPKIRPYQHRGFAEGTKTISRNIERAIKRDRKAIAYLPSVGARDTTYRVTLDTVET